MVVDHNRIVYVGDDAGANRMAQQYSRRVNLNGRTVLPGLHDVHNHIMEAYNAAAGTCELPLHTRPDAASMKTPFTRRYCQDNQVGTPWVLGGGYSLSKMLEYVAERRGDPKSILDELVVDHQGRARPAIMLEETSHSVWVNSEALRLAGLNKHSVAGKEHHGSLYMRNEATGELNGILFENAGAG